MNRIFFILAISLTLVACQAQNNVKPLDTKQFIELEAQENVKVIDVRTPGEVSAAYIEGTDYFFNISSSNFANQIASLDTNATYIVYCRSGARSSKALSFMSNNGFSNLYELSGGINAWKDKNLILSK